MNLHSAAKRSESDTSPATDGRDSQSPLKLTWHSINPSENRHRYFVLRVDEDLWGNFCVVRRWGRIGADNLRERYVWPASEADLERWVRHVCRAREDHGYELIGRGGEPT